MKDPRIQAHIQRLHDEFVPFADTLALIAELYDYTPTAFSNGVGEDRLDSPAGVNEGSCKVFAFARLNGLSKAETLACFGEHYQAVLNDPAGIGHPNIRLFMRHGWEGIRFDGEPLCRG
ncbi:HopJ type III effector protein [Thiofaba sp. EF100]|uniref:HopJ type III effector protein n=1 Tax=Thiofaba sp. EF100 TaxID=3121274 RepID=UPI0032215A16